MNTPPGQPPNPTAPSPSACRRELASLFDPKALIVFCFDRYPEVYDRFCPDQTPAQRLNRLIAAAEKTPGLAALLQQARAYAVGQVLPPPGEALAGEPTPTGPAREEVLPPSGGELEGGPAGRPTPLDYLTGRLSIEAALAIIFAVVFISASLVLAIFFPKPTEFQAFVFRVVLALSAAATVGAIIPGFINVEMSLGRRFALSATGAVAVFVLIYTLNPPQFTQATDATPQPTATATSPPTPLPTATLAFDPAGDGETLIVIATFHRAPEVMDAEPHREIRDAIRATADEVGLTTLRAEVEPTVLTVDDRTEAEALGREYDASIIIWGHETAARLTVNFLNLKEPDHPPTVVKITETERVAALVHSNPDPYLQFITTDLPGQLTFLALFAVGQSYYLNETYAEAIPVIERGIAALPPGIQQEGLADAYFLLGWLYQIPLKDYNQAITNYNEAINLNPNYAEAYNNRGMAYKDLYYLTQAIQDYNKAIDLNPDYAEAYNNQGVAYHASGDLEQAIADYNKAINLNSTLVIVKYNLGNAYAQSGDPKKAISFYDQVIESKPDCIPAYINRGSAFHDSGNLEQAILDYTKAIELDPNDVDGYFNRGLAFHDSGNLEQAILDYTKAIELDPNDADGYRNRGLAYHDSGDPEKAVGDFERYLYLEPNAPDREEIENLIEQLQSERPP